jgi:hypothetical protein
LNEKFINIITTAFDTQQQTRAKLQLITANMVQISNYCNFLFHSPETQAVKEFKELLSSQRYSNYLKSGKQLLDLRYSNDSHNENLELIKEDVKNLLDLLIRIDSPHSHYPSRDKNYFLISLTRSICDFLDIIQTHIDPDIIKNSASEMEGNPQTIQDSYQFLLESSKIKDLSEISDQYKDLNDDQIEILKAHKIDRKWIENYYGERINSIYPEFKAAYKRLQNSNLRGKFWIQDQDVEADGLYSLLCEEGPQEFLRIQKLKHFMDLDSITLMRDWYATPLWQKVKSLHEI